MPRFKTCAYCGGQFKQKPTERPAAFAVRVHCNPQCAGAARAADNEAVPWVCECAHPAPDGLGECAHCHRLVLSHSWHTGRPPVAVHPVNVCDVLPGAAMWDARDRAFMWVAANPDTGASLRTVSFEGGVTEDYDPRHTLQVADDPRAAERWMATERVA